MMGRIAVTTDHPRSRGVYPDFTPDASAVSGSSPLARGLPQDGLLDAGAARIIPARAGFTSVRSPRTSRIPDHPRSRGVYATAFPDVHPRVGSSPLARGLRDRVPRRPPKGGIIPARAGFTSYDRTSAGPARGSSPLARGLRRTPDHGRLPARIIPARAGFTMSVMKSDYKLGDHPRSRGVYTGARDYGSPGPGSSPLARGLRRPLNSILRCTRIIPARAGFTSQDAPTCADRTDHPRSRGVYVPVMMTVSPAFGSSPLARGLLKGTDIEAKKTGIIPARAGFTDTQTLLPRKVRDHPRSRGVYLSQLLGQRVILGSSPLARGLLHSGEHGDDACRIIPARAGFTRSYQNHLQKYWDHPRSRGVYLPVAWATSPWLGSSPLARGLRNGVRDHLHLRGIIPARAGFTSSPTATSSTLPDHPRSRGVYRGRRQRGRGRWGSSPLARGLPHRVRHAGAVARIIPARAGFTGTTPRTGPRYPDHPRSRGVYAGRTDLAGDYAGSSPLARGLPDDDAARAEPGRIIPARAGFTRSPRSRSPAWRDHPRSRGVYIADHPHSPALAGSSPLARGLPFVELRHSRPLRIIPARAGFTLT